MSIELSLPEARRLAVASQGFGPRPATASLGHLRKLAARLHAFQIDSVNVLARAHYVPAFARLGPYRMDALDALAYRKRELFEYWGHAACLLPISLYPLLRYRMHKHTERTQEYMRSARGAYMAKAYAEVAERGPIAAAELSNPGKRSGKWWGWAEGKERLEYLYGSGLLAIAGRRGFERLYDIADRVISRAALDASRERRASASARPRTAGTAVRARELPERAARPKPHSASRGSSSKRRRRSDGPRSRRGGWLPPAWTGGVSRPMSCPASAYLGPSTPERSSLRSTRSFGSGAACTASSG